MISIYQTKNHCFQKYISQWKQNQLSLSYQHIALNLIQNISRILNQEDFHKLIRQNKLIRDQSYKSSNSEPLINKSPHQKHPHHYNNSNDPNKCIHNPFCLTLLILNHLQSIVLLNIQKLLKSRRCVIDHCRQDLIPIV